MVYLKFHQANSTRISLVDDTWFVGFFIQKDEKVVVDVIQCKDGLLEWNRIFKVIAIDFHDSGFFWIHKVIGGIGVVEGNGGMLRPGLPWQTIHDGNRLMHDPLRLSVMIEAPQDEILAVLAKHAGVRDLFDNGWLHLFVLAEGKVAARYRPGLGWEPDPT